MELLLANIISIKRYVELQIKFEIFYLDRVEIVVVCSWLPLAVGLVHYTTIIVNCVTVTVVKSPDSNVHLNLFFFDCF